LGRRGKPTETYIQAHFHRLGKGSGRSVLWIATYWWW